MKDSRVGTFGALALGLSLLLRVSALAAIQQGAGVWALAAAVLVAAPWSRVEGLRILNTVEPTRRDGASAAVGQPERSVLPVAYGLSGVLALILVTAGALPLAGVVLGLILSLLVTYWLSRTAIRLIGGQTGDIIGAAQQLGEITIYLGLAFVIGWGGPCIKVCVIDPASKLCQGCGRTLQEIAQWSRLSEPERLAIM
eukprot:gene11096-14192_t